MNTFEIQPNNLTAKERKKQFATQIQAHIDNCHYKTARKHLESTDDIELLNKAVKELQDRKEHYCAHKPFSIKKQESVEARKQAKEAGDIDALLTLGHQVIDECETWGIKHGWEIDPEQLSSSNQDETQITEQVVLPLEVDEETNDDGNIKTA
ncbi:hypothetical protein KC851_00690 [Candidatus Kaiserbacteria bacterium]|nr:hypothetical protein [Candidatus Kaiserbacteria bacterium]